MKLKALASEIAKREGKKSQARIGDIREILGVLADILVEEEQVTPEHELMDTLVQFAIEGHKRAQKKAKKK